MAEDVFYNRLAKSVTHNYTALSSYRKSVRSYIKDFAGTLYGGTSAASEHFELPDKDILPVSYQATEALVVSIASSRPRAIVRSQVPRFGGFSDHVKRALDFYSQKLDLGRTLSEVALDASFGLGVVKVHMKEGKAVELEPDEWMTPGEPYIERISSDDLVFQVAAKGLRHVSFVGNKYEVDRDKVLADDRYDEATLEKLRGLGPDKTGRSYRDDISGNLSQVGGGDKGLFDKLVFCDIFVPAKRMVYTFVCDHNFNVKIPEPIGRVKWEGSETGCYFFLNWGPVPNNTLPSPPAQHIKLLSELVNTVYRKLEDQAENQKDISVGPNSDGEDSSKVAGSRNGEHLELNSPHAVSQIKFPGPDQGLFAFFINAREQLSNAANNLDFKMGLGAQADTATQEGIIGQQVSRLEAGYQLRYIEFVRDVYTELARLLFYDEVTTFDFPREVGSSQTIETWKPYGEDGARQGEFEDFQFDIDPYSLAYKPPSQRAAELKQLFFELLPATPQMAQQGIQPDFKSFLEEMAKLNDSPEVRKFFRYDAPLPDPMMQQGQEQQAQGGGGPQEAKEYIHRNVSGGSAQGRKQEQMMQALSNAGGQ